jgi:hypothetical protein
MEYRVELSSLACSGLVIGGFINGSNRHAVHRVQGGRVGFSCGNPGVFWQSLHHGRLRTQLVGSRDAYWWHDADCRLVRLLSSPFAGLSVSVSKKSEVLRNKDGDGVVVMGEAPGSWETTRLAFTPSRWVVFRRFFRWNSLSVAEGERQHKPSTRGASATRSMRPGPVFLPTSEKLCEAPTYWPCRLP